MKYSNFLNKEVVLILKGQTYFTLMTEEGPIQTNSLVAYLLDLDDHHYMLNPESAHGNCTIMVAKNEVAMISLAPREDLVDVEFNSDFEESDLN